MAKKTVVLGAGISGLAVTKLLLQEGHHVLLIDDAPKEKLRHFACFDEQQHPLLTTSFARETYPETMFLDVEMVVTSPGVSLRHPLLEKARLLNIPLATELDCAAPFFTTSRFIGITGTNGKSTTTSLVAHLLSTAGFSVFAGGNLGEPLSSLAIRKEKPDFIVLELSSYQLELLHKVRLQASVILNLTKDHIERHGSMEQYAEAKLRIFSLTHPKGLRLRGESSWLARSDALTFGPDPDFDLPSLGILGEHNAQNAHAALRIVKHVGLHQDDIKEGLKTFKNLPHRSENLGQKKGLWFINDSKATNVAAAGFALTMSEKSTHLLLGGIDKGEDFGLLNRRHYPHVKRYYVFGQSKPKIAQDLGDEPLVLCDNLQEAFQKATEEALEGELVLLSPACASFDQFQNFAERGDMFKALVSAL